MNYVQTRLNQFIDNLVSLRSQPYHNPELNVLESKIVGFLATNFGTESLVCKQFLNKTQIGYWRVGKGDPRGSFSSPSTYQKEYVSHLNEYIRHLEAANTMI